MKDRVWFQKKTVWTTKDGGCDYEM
jgi:hypothetical protein